MSQKTFPPHFIIKDGIEGNGVFVVHDFKKGSLLFSMHGPIIPYPTRTSVQVGKNKHVEDPLAGHLNHHCKPNARIDRLTQSLVCLRDIKNGEEVTFNYNDNEDLLAEPFNCGCCQRMISGKKMSFPKEFKKPAIGKYKKKSTV